MHWIAADLTMFACSVSVYVAVRKAALDGLPSQFNNLAMFAIPLPIFLFIGIIGGEDFSLSWLQVFELLGAGGAVSYLGNALSMRSIAMAPNPGYSLLLSKSYVVFTTVWAVLFFDSPVTSRAVTAIAVIVVGSALIMIDQSTGTSRPRTGSWLPSAIGAFFCWGFLSLIAKHLQSQGVPTAVFLTYLFTVANSYIVIEMRARHIEIKTVTSNAVPFVAIGVTATGFNFFNFYAIDLAPNVGYVNATNTASIGAVTLVAALLFRDELTPRKLVGIAGVFVGLLLLVL